MDRCLCKIRASVGVVVRRRAPRFGRDQQLSGFLVSSRGTWAPPELRISYGPGPTPPTSKFVRRLPGPRRAWPGLRHSRRCRRGPPPPQHRRGPERRRQKPGVCLAEVRPAVHQGCRSLLAYQGRMYEEAVAARLPRVPGAECGALVAWAPPRFAPGQETGEEQHLIPVEVLALRCRLESGGS